MKVARLRLGAALVLLLVAFPAGAQLRSVRAELATEVESDARAGSRVRGFLQVSVPEGFHLQSNAPRDPSLIPTTLTFTAIPGIRAEEVVYPKATDFLLQGQAEPLAVFERQFLVGVEFSVAADAPPGPIEVPARFRYQACDDKLCFAPVTTDVRWTLNVVGAKAAVTRRQPDLFGQIAFGTGARPPQEDEPAPLLPAPPAVSATPATLDDFAVVATAGGYMGTDAFLTFIRNAEQGVKETGWFEGRGPLAILLLVLVGGMALNLTPCVLPMIPINLAIIGAGAKASSRSRGFLLGGVYGLAMAAVYGGLGLIVILTAGTFGTINASPWFNLAIALVFVALALAMFDIFEIDFSRFSSGVGTGGGASRGSLALAFGMGAIAALLAGACVAPVVIQVVVFSSDLYAQGTVIALGLPFVLGIGMAIPWPIAGAGLTRLPKPGAWMVRVKQALGVVILATAAYYGYLAYTLFADRWVDAGAVTSSVEELLKDGWHASLDEGLAEARRERKPVLVDMWATWCKNCLTMDKTTLADPAVKAALDGYVKVKFQAEQLDESPAREVIERFGGIGLPTYAILRPAAATE
jgi:thioredoxin:protein disulfide reductase